VHHGGKKKKKKLKWEAGHLVKSLAAGFTEIEPALGSLQNAQNQNINKANIIAFYLGYKIFLKTLHPY
jgi:hypothetical protein